MSDTKPREWWIGKYSKQLMHRQPANATERELVIHVIEKSAYDRLAAELAAAEKDRNKWVDLALARLATDEKWADGVNAALAEQLQAERERAEVLLAQQQEALRKWSAAIDERDAAQAEVEQYRLECEALRKQNWANLKGNPDLANIYWTKANQIRDERERK